jgi:hypothetical protein
MGRSAREKSFLTSDPLIMADIRLVCEFPNFGLNAKEYQLYEAFVCTR